MPIIFTVIFCFSCCEKNNIPVDTSEYSMAVQWKVTEMTFTSDSSYANSFNDIDMDVVFIHKNGTELLIPAFWSGGDRWTVRFALTLPGIWTYSTVCTDETNAELHNISGNYNCENYTGEMDIYKHGFVTTISSNRYFTYADGKPFFYLGDTHWNIPANSLTNFKTIIDKRVEQGFTVIQSEPISAGYDLSNSITEADLIYFDNLDERFEYIAEKGFVHANAQLFFVSTLAWNRSKYPDDYLEKLCRYWVARYSAYPVMWTTAQECDNDFYYERGDQNYFDAITNPWKLVANNIYKYDPYKHPQTAHMESTSYTLASQSSFRNLSGHSWYAAQWSPKKNNQLNFNIPKNFWYNGQSKPIVNYEGHYDHLWTNHFGARMQGWTAFLNGMYGHGYGAIDIWLYNSSYNMDVPSIVYDITITVEDKQTKWEESLEFTSAYQMGYMHSFFQSREWWELIPRFDYQTWFTNNGSWYSLASKDNDLYVAYFYNNTNTRTGTIKNLDNTNYLVQWFDPILGVYREDKTVSIQDGSYFIGDKPDINDWVLLMTKIK